MYTGNRHCFFSPSQPNPDNYLDTSPPCTIPSTPSQTGTYHAASGAHCTFTPPLPAGTDPDAYINTTPTRCQYPGTPDIHGTVTNTVVGSDVGMLFGYGVRGEPPPLTRTEHREDSVVGPPSEDRGQLAHTLGRLHSARWNI